MRAGFIAVAWGGTGFRAWLLDPEGTVHDRRESPDGLGTVRDRAFAAVFTANCGDWLTATPKLPVLLSGMVGSRTGWVEAPYLPCPLGPDDLLGGAARIDLDGHDLAFLPGARAADAEGDLDVMRGEELQILGAAAAEGIADAEICIPGTHAKRATLRGGRLVGFRTYITGELFKLLRQNSLVGALAEGDAFDPGAFERGLRRGGRAPLSHAVFAARANALNGTLAPHEVSAYLSGVLIGGELADYPDGGPPLLLLASGILAERYEAALKMLGRPFRRIDARDAALAGFRMVGTRMLAGA